MDLCTLFLCSLPNIVSHPCQKALDDELNTVQQKREFSLTCCGQNRITQDFLPKKRQLLSISFTFPRKMKVW